MNRKFFKRTLSFAMAAAVSLTTLCGITSVSVAAEETTDVYRTIFSDNFESGKDLPNKTVYPSNWTELVQYQGSGASGSYETDTDGNTWYYLNAGNNTWAYAHAYRIGKEFDEPITSGKHRLSFDVKVPTGANVEGSAMNVNLLYGQEQGKNDFSVANQIAFVLYGNGKIAFNGWTHTGATTETGLITAEQMLTGVTIAEEYDYSTQKIATYINGTKVKEWTMNTGSTNKINGISFLSGFGGSGLNQFYIDNVKFETANDPISVSNVSVVRGGVEYSADYAPIGANQIKIKFDKNPGNEIIKNITLNDGTNDVALTGSYDSTTKTYSATFSGLEEGKNYTLKIDKGIMGLASDYSKTFSPVSVPWKTTFSDDFESGKDLANKTVYPSNWTELVQYQGPGASGSYETDTNGNTWYYLNAGKNTYNYEHAYRIGKEFDEPITSGKHRLSFDVKVPTNANVEGSAMNVNLLYGYQQGINDFSVANQIAFVLYGNGKIAFNSWTHGSGATTETGLITAEQMLTGVTIAEEYDYSTQKIVTYINGTKVKEWTMNTGATSKINGISFLSGFGDNGLNQFYIDNVKFETVCSPISVSSVKFTKYGKEYDTTNVPAGATGVKIIFSDDVTDYVKDCVTLKNGENNVTVNGTYDKETNTFTGTFDALGDETAYILTVGKNALFTAEDYTTGFTTKGGIQLNNITFTPGEGNAVSVKYDLTRFIGSGTAVVIAAVYEGDRVVQAVSENVTFGSDESGNGTLNVSKTDGQTLKVFVWDSLDSLMPLFPVHPMTSGN